jgi:hypothetical protein
MRGLLAVVPFLYLFGCANAEDDSDATGVPKSPYWSSGSTTDEGKSTHLWIVDHAEAILRKHPTLTRASRAYTWLSNAACSERWRQGLEDADDKVSYNNWWTFKSHFYDPSTGTNYLGGTSPVAYNEALSHLAAAKTGLSKGDVKNGCYELGLALHYATDITAPQHAANFAATDKPIQLHSHLEDRASEVQSQFVVLDWSAAPTDTVNTVLTNTAWASHDLWPSVWTALANAYRARCNDDIDDYTLDHTSCWQGDAGVDAQIGVALRQAQTTTAAFLYAADLP